jgi:hypothetical protein
MWIAAVYHVRLAIELCDSLLASASHTEPREKDDEREACDTAYNAAGYSPDGCR